MGEGTSNESMEEGVEEMSILERVVRLEKLNGITGPAICPDPTGEGSAWQGEAARSVPVGWVKKNGEAGTITPDPSIPWGEEYEAIFPSEAKEGDEYWSANRWWKSGGNDFHPRAPGCFPWRRRKPPVEPAPGSDAKHPPVGYRLEPGGGERRRGYLWWHPDRREWIPCTVCVGLKVEADIIANPIPANEGDSQKEVAELRATVERLTAERDELRGKLAKVAEVLG